MKLQLLVFSFLFIVISGCNHDNNIQDKVFIGGQIVNPKSNYFILSKENQVLDTLYLDQNNQFGKNFEGLEEGIYRFNHPPENQIMYLEPGDSILIWLNTMEFDESINFSGRGAQKSQFLLELFLENKQNTNLILSYYKYPPTEFEKIIDSLKANKEINLEELSEEQEFSDDFLEIARAGITYQNYHYKERYAFLTRKYFKELAQEIPGNFHDYREEIEFDNEKLNSYYVYSNFLDDYFSTRAIENCALDLPPTHDCFNLNSISNIRHKILMADSVIENPAIKNSYFERLAAQGITFSDKRGNLDSIINLLETVDYTNHRLDDLKQMAKIQKSLMPGNDIGDLQLTNYQGDTIALEEISDRPMITYHWSIYSKGHFYWQQDVVRQLREKYPEVDFVGINIDQDAQETWMSIVQNESLHPDFEFHLSFTRIKPDLLKPYLNKLFFLDSNGVIVQGSSQLNSPTFEREILEFLNELQ